MKWCTPQQRFHIRPYVRIGHWEQYYILTGEKNFARGSLMKCLGCRLNVFPLPHKIACLCHILSLSFSTVTHIITLMQMHAVSVRISPSVGFRSTRLLRGGDGARGEVCHDCAVVATLISLREALLFIRQGCVLHCFFLVFHIRLFTVRLDGLARMECVAFAGGSTRALVEFEKNVTPQLTKKKNIIRFPVLDASFRRFQAATHFFNFFL